MASSRACRTISVPLKVLESDIEIIENELREIIELDLSKFNGESQHLSELAIQSKNLFKTYSDVSCSIVDCLLKSGSIAKANEFKSDRSRLRVELRQFIAIARHVGLDENMDIGSLTLDSTRDSCDTILDRPLMSSLSLIHI